LTLVNSANSKIPESEINPIYKLNKIINQELHNLRPTSTIDSLTFNSDKRSLFAQAVLIRSFDLNYMEMANKSREFLIQLKKPFLDIRWAQVRSKADLIMTLEGHSDGVISATITSDNSKIVSGSDDDTVKIWNLNTGKLLNPLEGHSSAVTSVAITSDNTKIVSGSDDDTVKIWNLNTGKLLNTLKGHTFTIQSIAITTDNTKILAASIVGCGIFLTYIM
jgi:WD40 repeat protein